MTDRDKELLQKLETLVKAAQDEVLRYRKKYGYSQEVYDRYRISCFALINEYFWKIVRQMEWNPPTRHIGTGAEDNITAYLEACYAHRDGGWLNTVLTEIGY